MYVRIRTKLRMSLLVLILLMALLMGPEKALELLIRVTSGLAT